MCIKCGTGNINTNETFSGYSCDNIKCGSNYPVINDVPVILDGRCENSFSEEDILNDKSYLIDRKRHSSFYKWLTSLVPTNTANVSTKRIMNDFLERLPINSKILNIGVLDGGSHLERLYAKHIVFEVDIQPKDGLLCICDLHNLPFFDQTFDAVIVQNVLEHVLSPQKCVDNIYRVLKIDGYVYSEIPFLQHVHAGKHDYMRFTKRGHIYLYKNFEIIDSGWVSGPATVLSWAVESFVLSFNFFSNFKKISMTIIRFTFFWLKYIDFYWANKDRLSSGASATFCFCKKSDRPISSLEFMNINP